MSMDFQTNALKKLVDSWMEGIIALVCQKKDSHDDVLAYVPL